MKQSEKYRSRHSMEVPGKSTEVPGKSTEAPDNCQELPWSRKKSLYDCHENAAGVPKSRGALWKPKTIARIIIGKDKNDKKTGLSLAV